MKIKCVQWIFALIAAAVSVFAVFYANLCGVRLDMNGMHYKTSALFLLGAAALFVISEYVYFGHKDTPKQMMYRFVIHNVMSFICSYLGYAIYSFADMQEKYVLAVTVFNALLPICFQSFFAVTAIAAVVCVIACIIRHFKNKKEDKAA